MKKVKNLSVQVTYRVGLGEVNMPQKVYAQLIEAFESGAEIDPCDNRKYADAADWLSNNIKEGDCTDWSAEIEEIN